MMIMLDANVKKIQQIRERTNIEICQLRTPLTRYRSDPSIPYGLDNGAYSGFKSYTFETMAAQAEEDDHCQWIALPDIVGCAYSTLALFHAWKSVIQSKRAFVLQNGCNYLPIPWDEFDVLFIGGDDSFKMGPTAMMYAKIAHLKNKLVHVGRINTPKRADHWFGIADSIDGSGISKYDHMLDSMIDYLEENKDKIQRRLDE